MEILRDSSDKRTLLVVTDDDARAKALRHALENAFNVVYCLDASEALAIMNERFRALSATLIDVEAADADNCAFLRALAAERCYDTIPVLVISDDPSSEMCIHCLDGGAVDVLEVPCVTRVLQQRINNAIELKRSTTFYEIESMLHVLPSMIFLKDAEGRYVFSTQYWHHLDMGGDPKWTIRGKTDVDIRKDRENALMAMEADKEIIRTGKGTSYVIEINTDGVQEFIQLIKEPVFDEFGNVTGIIALGNDVTESELMKRKLERYARIDELTRVGNRRGFNEFIESVPNRNDFPLAVISADCDNLKIINDTLGHLVGDEYIRMAATALVAALPEDAFVFRIGGDEFVAFAPNTTLEQTEALVADMRHNESHFRLSQGEAVVSYGAACINGPQDDVMSVIGLADQHMYEEKAEHKRRAAHQ